MDEQFELSKSWVNSNFDSLSHVLTSRDWVQTPYEHERNEKKKKHPRVIKTCVSLAQWGGNYIIENQHVHSHFTFQQYEAIFLVTGAIARTSMV